MWSTYLLIFLMLCIGAAGWLLFIWAVKSGQYDDVEGPKYRMLDDDEQETLPHDRLTKKQPTLSVPSTGSKDADTSTS